MSVKRDITGQTFNYLKAIKCTGEKSGTSYIWEFECLLCGKIINARIGQVTNGAIKSCGCLKAKNLKTKPIHDKLGQVMGTNISRITSEKKQKNNTSGYRGVYLLKRKGRADRWQAYIYFQGKKYYLGNYVNIIDAAHARKEAEKHIYGKFLNWYNSKHNINEKESIKIKK